MNDVDQNPSHVSPPCILVIFGAAGDLTKRKLIPALYNLRQNNLLPDDFAVIGVARAEMNDEEFQRRLRNDLEEFATEEIESQISDWLAERLSYLSGDFEDEQTYADLKDRLAKLENSRNTGGNIWFYLATAPQYFSSVNQKLGAAGLTKETKTPRGRGGIEKTLRYGPLNEQ